MRIVLKGRFRKHDRQVACKRISACRDVLEARGICSPPFVFGTLNVKELEEEFQIPDWANVMDIPVEELEKVDPGWYESWKLIPIETINGTGIPAFILKPQKTPHDNHTVEIIAHSISLKDGAEVEIILSNALTLKDPHDFTKIIAKVIQKLPHEGIWWRGQSKSKWDLIPSVYRCRRDPDYEQNVCSDFIAKAPARYQKNCPSLAEPASWLILMQHYGLPTRLLDWTESFLVALYFAVLEHDCAPGALWALDPGKLNNDNIPWVKRPQILNPQIDRIQPTFKAAYAKDVTECIYKAAAVMAPHEDLRVLVQQSAFTVHGDRTSLSKLPNEDKFLLKIKIPPKQKLECRAYLRELGIRGSSLFPDLEHLAEELESEENLKLHKRLNALENEAS